MYAKVKNGYVQWAKTTAGKQGGHTTSHVYMIYMGTTEKTDTSQTPTASKMQPEIKMPI